MTVRHTKSHNIEFGDLKKIGLQDVHVVTKGQGRPVILIHGYAFSLNSYRKILDPLAKDNWVHAIDLPGCGWSPKPVGDCDVDTFAKLINDYLELTGISSATIIGSFEGGIIAMRFAELYPHKADSLILISPGSITVGYPLYYRLLHIKFLGELILRYANKNNLTKWLKWNVFNETCVDEEMVSSYMEFAERTDAKQLFLQLMREYSENETVQNMGSIRTPSLLVWGELDKGHPSYHGENLVNMLPNGRIRFIRNSAGLVQEEKPLELTKIVNNFINAASRIIK